jgi:hypothetical protein
MTAARDISHREHPIRAMYPEGKTPTCVRLRLHCGGAFVPGRKPNSARIPVPDRHGLDSLSHYIERHVDLIIEVLQRAHRAHLGITCGPAERHSPSVDVTIELPEKHACPPPSEEPTKCSGDIPGHGCVIVIVERIAVGIMRFGVSTPSALVIKKRKELLFLFGHHGTYSPPQ